VKLRLWRFAFGEDGSGACAMRRLQPPTPTRYCSLNHPPLNGSTATGIMLMDSMSVGADFDSTIVGTAVATPGKTVIECEASER